MTSGFFSRRAAVLVAVSTSLLLAACGGSDDDGGGQTSLRAINLTTDLASVDLYTGDTRRFSALPADSVASYITLDANTYALNVRRAGDSTTLYSDNFSLTKDRRFTALITGRESGLVVRTLPEDETAAIDAGTARMRLFNLTSDTTGVDVFVTTLDADIGDRQPTIRFTTNSLSDFITFPTGTAYRLRVTSVGNPTDVRLDIPLAALVERQYSTLVLTSGLGGALVNATLVAQQSTATSLKNTKARVRVAAGADGAGNISATLGGATLVGTLRSPGVNTYALVNAGTQDLTVRINGTPVSTGNRSFLAGADYTVLVYGTAAAGTVSILSDDNRLPNTSTRAKVRLVNATAGLEPITLQLDFLPLASDVRLGTGSAYATANSAGSSYLEVSSPNAAAALYTNTAATGAVLLQAQGVYTVFMLGGDATRPAGATGVLRKDR